MKKNNTIKVQIEYKNVIGMSVLVKKKISEEELLLLEQRDDIKVIRRESKNTSRIA